jgi:hypothetical protein
MVTQIAYTNSNCSDLWDMFVKENKQNTNIPLFMISDKHIDSMSNEKQLIYDNDEPYYQVWSKAANMFGDKYFIYLQEDFILYNKVNEGKIKEYCDFLDKNPQYSFIRLIKSGNLLNKKLSSTLYEIECDNINIFAMQATIWRTIDYIKLMNVVKSKGWLNEGDYRNTMINLNMMGAYHYDNEIKRGSAHYDSNVYPYIATALVKGRWNIREYNNELSKLLLKYGIYINRRGIL